MVEFISQVTQARATTLPLHVATGANLKYESTNESVALNAPLNSQEIARFRNASACCAAEEVAHAPSFDLANVVTPIVVVLRCERREPIRITLKDFRLRDARGFQFAAVSPNDAAHCYSPRAGGDDQATAPPVHLPIRRFFYECFFHNRRRDFHSYPPYCYEDSRYEVTLRGLQSGQLQPGATGFLFFQRTDVRTGSMKLEWDAPRSQGGIARSLSHDAPLADRES